MKSVPERISEILDFFCMRAAPFANSVGVKPTQIYDLQSGKTKSISNSMADKIINQYPALNKAWLLSGEGEMLSSVVDNMQRLIPFYDVETTGGFNDRVSASDGEGRVVGHIDAGGWFNGKETAAIRHTGDSMVEYTSGCILAVREVRDRSLLVPGKNYVIETDEYRLTKRVQRGSMPDRIALYSTNEETYADGRLIHEPFEVKFEDIRKIFSVLGYVVNEFGEIRIIK